MKRWKYEEVKKFIEENSNCKLLSKEYKNIDTKLKFKCECGKSIETTFDKFKSRNKRQCNECSKKILSNKKRLTYEEVKHFIEIDSNSGCKLLSKEYNNAQEKLLIQCKCGNTFETLFCIFRDYDVHSCKICREKEKSISKGEVKIEKWLVNNNIKYKKQYTFEDCRHDRKLKFDFAILNKDNNVKMLIEFDGKQHFGLGLFSDDTNKMLEQYSKVKQSDETKNSYCFKKSIPLLRIPYSKYSDIDKILSDSLL